MTQRELADFAGLSKGYISQIESGQAKGMKVETFQQLAGELSDTPNEIIKRYMISPRSIRDAFTSDALPPSTLYYTAMYLAEKIILHEYYSKEIRTIVLDASKDLETACHALENALNVVKKRMDDLKRCEEMLETLSGNKHHVAPTNSPD